MVLSVGYANSSAIFASASQTLVAGYQANIAESAATPAKNSGINTASATQAGKGVSTYDFTSMTPNQMQDVVKDLLKSGKLGEKISAGTLRLQMIGMPIIRDNYSPAQLAEYANKPVNYIQALQGNLEFLKHAGNADERERVQDLLATLQSMQGTTSGVNITA